MAIDNDWLRPLSAEFKKPYYRALYTRVKEEYAHYQIFPESKDLFQAFELTPLSRVKAVILGQDPYHGEGQAHGLCFSVKPGVDIPPSLQNIYKELHADLGCYIPDNGCLIPWAKQGVLLLNTLLTVRAHQAFSHKGIGWEQFTDAAIRALDEEERPIVFMLWGRPAQEKAAMLHNPKHLILKAPHPSPLSASRGFFGCRHFSQCNAFLAAHGIEPIDWQIPNIGVQPGKTAQSRAGGGNVGQSRAGVRNVPPQDQKAVLESTPDTDGFVPASADELF